MRTFAHDAKVDLRWIACDFLTFCVRVGVNSPENRVSETAARIAALDPGFEGAKRWDEMVWQTINAVLDYIQLTLTWLGIAPGAANTIISLLRLRFGDAAWNFVGIIPYLGTATNAARLGRAGVAVLSRYNKILAGARRIAMGFKGFLETGKYAGTLAGRLASRGFELIFCKAFNLACFTAGTPIETEFGSQAIETIKVGDKVWSRDEFDADAPAGLKVVEELFTRHSQILQLNVGNAIIGTTAEHPFWVVSKGWVNANELAPGDTLIGKDGQEVAISQVEDTGEWATVYNMRVADWHTYFVGAAEWG